MGEAVEAEPNHPSKMLEKRFDENVPALSGEPERGFAVEVVGLGGAVGFCLAVPSPSISSSSSLSERSKAFARLTSSASFSAAGSSRLDSRGSAARIVVQGTVL